LKVEVITLPGATRVATNIDPATGEVKVIADGTAGQDVTLRVAKLDPEKGTAQQGVITTKGSATGSITVRADAWAPGAPLDAEQDKGDGQPPTRLSDGCANGKKDAAESDVDCGGVCTTKCDVGRACSLADDCLSLACNAGTKTCVSTLCDDGVKNGAETDLDCGGNVCRACATGKACALPGDCTSNVCTNNVCAAPAVPDKTVFLSSVAYDGNLGGLAGADAKCQALATAAALPGTYKAFLSDAGFTASLRLTKGAGRYVLVNKQVVADSANTFFSDVHLIGINRDESNVLINGAEVWTGSSGNGLGAGGCLDWTSSAVGSPTPIVGLGSASDATWANVYTQTCDRTQRLYCVEQ
jgi:hypothetical protein